MRTRVLLAAAAVFSAPAALAASEAPIHEQIETLQQQLDALRDQVEAPAAPQVRADVRDLELRTHDGIELRSLSDGFSIKLRGLLAMSHEWVDGIFNAENTGKRAFEGEIRSFWAILSGTHAHHWKYTAMYNFKDSRPVVAYIRYDRPEGWRLTLGRQREPFGLAQFSSGDLASAATLSTRIAPLISQGFSLLAFGEHWTWGIGLFSEGTGANGEADEAFTSRVSLSPSVSDAQRVHLAASLSRRDYGTDPFYIESNLGAATAPTQVAQSPDFDAQRGWLSGMEFAWQHRSVYLQTEWIGARIRADDATRYSFRAHYAQLGWFLTGEHLSYDTKNGRFKRFKEQPLNPGGAWQWVVRYEDLDLEDRGGGSEVYAWTTGINWYANSKVRVLLNYTDVSAKGSINLGSNVLTGHHDGQFVALVGQYFF